MRRLKWQQTCTRVQVAPGWAVTVQRVPGRRFSCQGWMLLCRPLPYSGAAPCPLPLLLLFCNSLSEHGLGLCQPKSMSESPFSCLKPSTSPGGNLLCPQFFDSLSSLESMENNKCWALSSHGSTWSEKATLEKMQNGKKIIYFKKWILLHCHFSIFSFCTLFISPHCLWDLAFVDSKPHLLTWKSSGPCSLQSPASLSVYSLSSFEVIWKYQHIWINAIKTLTSSKHTVFIPSAELSLFFTSVLSRQSLECLQFLKGRHLCADHW